MEKLSKKYKGLIQRVAMISAVFGALFTCGYALASDATTPADFFVQVMQSAQGFGVLPWWLKVATLVNLAIASMKVGLINQKLWQKLGPMQTWLAPLLGLVAGLATQGDHMTLKVALTWCSAGAGAIILHELLDSIKGWPGLGTAYVSLINVIEGCLTIPPPTTTATVQATATDTPAPTTPALPASPSA